MDQWDRNESSGMNSHIYSLLIFNGEPRQFSGGKNSLFSTQAWTTGYPHKLGQLAIHTNKRMTLEPFPVAYTKRSRCAPQIQTQDWRLGKVKRWGPKPESTGRVSAKVQVPTMTAVVPCRQGPGLHTDDCGPLPRTFEVGKCQ